MGVAGTVLVVDEDALVRGVAEIMLARSSYRVLTASSGATALEVLGGHPEVDLVLSEATLQEGISGPELIRKVRQSFPSAAVMVMTAYAEESLDPATPFLAKPFTRSALITRVEQVLARSRQLRAELSEEVSRTRQTIERSRQIRRWGKEQDKE